MYIKKIIFSGFLMGSQLLVAESLAFQKDDWEVVCDNTNMCRIAGYSSDESDYRVSVLFERKAGAKQRVTAKVQLAYFGEDDEKIYKKLPSPFPLELLINNKSYGSVSMKKDTLIASLSKKQREALIASLRKNSTIVWKSKGYKWKLSDAGASAVLLKADEFQKRVGTVGALYKKGIKSEKGVLKAKEEPIIYAERLPTNKAKIVHSKYMNLLNKELILHEAECDLTNEEDTKLVLHTLSASKLLASKGCWMAAYNRGIAYWVINKKPPFEPELVITEGTDYYIDDDHHAVISSNQKGRGIGDCWSYESFVWTGKTFEPSLEGTTGMCRAIAGGGAWQLPTFVSIVKDKK